MKKISEYYDSSTSMSDGEAQRIAVGLATFGRIANARSAASGFWTDTETGLPLMEAAGRFAPFVIGTKLALIHSEVSEALEGQRKGLKDDKLPQYDALAVELADSLVRTVEFMHHMGYDIGAIVLAKMQYNASRADHKPENRAQEGGKQF